jgi:LytS/YehU family sensor histidine kinase
MRPFSFRVFPISRLEYAFFGLLFLAFPLLTDVEYTLYEANGTGLTLHLLAERLVYGLSRLMPYLVYYRFLMPLALGKRYGAFAAGLVLFLGLLELYQVYVVYGLMMRLPFLPDALVSSARRAYEARVPLHFSVVYVLRDLLTVSTVGYFMHSERQEKALHRLRHQKLQDELNHLKVKLQPHFFFNTLNSLYALALEGSTQTAFLVARYAQVMRYVLYDAERARVSLSGEVAFIQNFVEVEALRHHQRVRINFDSQGIDDSVWIEPLLLLPPVENAFKHNHSSPAEPGWVSVIVVLFGNELTLEVKNSKGPYEGLPHEGGVGLESTRRRLALLYPGRHTLLVEEDPHAYQLRLTLQLTPNGELPDSRR